MTIGSVSKTFQTLFVVLSFFSSQAYAATPTAPHYNAVAFGYFIIFDPNSVVPTVENVFPGKGVEFTKAWRSKQFEYGFLRSITNDHEDFVKVTADAMDFTAEQMHLTLTPETRARLLNAYLTLKPWPDAVRALKKLKAAGVHIITISNLFDELVSTEANGTFKPDPRAYELGMKTFHLSKDEMFFAAFGGWDAYGAKKFGYPTVWVNRFNVPMEKLGTTPDRESTNIDAVVDFVLGAAHN
jgi:2-haloacid dehalogenase